MGKKVVVLIGYGFFFFFFLFICLFFPVVLLGIFRVMSAEKNPPSPFTHYLIGKRKTAEFIGRGSFFATLHFDGYHGGCSR